MAFLPPCARALQHHLPSLVASSSVRALCSSTSAFPLFPARPSRTRAAASSPLVFAAAAAAASWKGKGREMSSSTTTGESPRTPSAAGRVVPEEGGLGVGGTGQSSLLRLLWSEG